MSELSSDAKRLLAQLRELDNPTPRERASGDAAVRDMLAAHGVPALPALDAVESPEPAAVAAGSGAAFKLGVSLGAALVVAVGLYVWRASEPAPPVAAPAVAAPAPTSEPAPVSRAAEIEPPARPEAPRVAAAVSSGPRARHAKPRAADSGAAAELPTPAPESTLSAELKFLASVDAELRAGAYSHALQRLDQHKGSAVLAEERTALRVLALCGRDNDDRAARARDHFLSGSPSSVLAARVRAACSTGPQP